MGILHHTGETVEHRSKVPGTGIEAQDIAGDRVFAAKEFWYFNQNALVIPMSAA